MVVPDVRRATVDVTADVTAQERVTSPESSVFEATPRHVSLSSSLTSVRRFSRKRVVSDEHFSDIEV